MHWPAARDELAQEDYCVRRVRRSLRTDAAPESCVNIEAAIDLCRESEPQGGARPRNRDQLRQQQRRQWEVV
jgi:hypothetical protein